MKNICKNLKKLYLSLHKIPSWIWLIPILLLATHVRLLYLTKADIWHDEGYTAAIIKQPLLTLSPPQLQMYIHHFITLSCIFGNYYLATQSFRLEALALHVAS